MLKNFTLFFWVMALLPQLSFSAKKSVNPKHLLQELHYLYKSIDLDTSFDSVTLKGPSHIEENQFDPNGRISTLPIEEYLKQLSLSQSIFPATTGSGRGAGSAFYVGGNFILTNKHVAETTYEKKECGEFNIKVEVPFKEAVQCKKVHYCSRFYDFCLIEMQNFSNGDPLAKHLPALEFANTADKPYLYNIYGIGNSVDLGIQGAKGDHLYRIYEGGKFLFVHYVPSFPGSSGSPLLNERGKVVGINFAQNILWRGGPTIMESLGSKNFAVPMDTMLGTLKTGVSAEIFEQLGHSKIKHVSARVLKKQLKKVNQLMYADGEFERVLHFLKEHNTLDKLNSIDLAELEQTNLYDLVNELGIENPSEKGFVKIALVDQRPLYAKVAKVIKRELIDGHIQVLKNKTTYFSAISECRNTLSVDGCLFNKLFRPYYDQVFSSLPLSDGQKETVWNMLAEIISSSTSELFIYSAKEVDVNRAMLAIKEMSDMDYFSKCVKYQKEKFTHVYPGHCKDVTREILNDVKYDDVSVELIESVYSHFLDSDEFRKIAKSFSQQVTQRDFPCLFNNRICENFQYKKLISFWEYNRELTDLQREELRYGLVRKHKR